MHALELGWFCTQPPTNMNTTRIYQANVGALLTFEFTHGFSRYSVCGALLLYNNHKLLTNKLLVCGMLSVCVLNIIVVVLWWYN